MKRSKPSIRFGSEFLWVKSKRPKCKTPWRYHAKLLDFRLAKLKQALKGKCTESSSAAISTEEGCAWPWTPDGRFLAVQRGGLGEDQYTICLVSAEIGEKSGPLTSPPPKSLGDTKPAVSPKGDSLAFLRVRGGSFVCDICLLPVADGKPSGKAWRLTQARDYYGLGEVTWTLDGRELLFPSVRSERTSLWRIAVSPGAEAQRIPGTDGGFVTFESPHGKALIYTKGGFYSPGLWSMPTEGGKELPIPLLSSVLPGYSAVADRGVYFIDFEDFQKPNN